MNKKLLFLAATIPAALGVFASPLTPEQALSRARNGAPAAMRARAKASLKPVYTAVSAAGQSAAYVFNTDGQGYMILAADDVAYPVLGYSETGSIDPQNMSPELKWWLGEYARQIEWAAENGMPEAKAPAAPKDREAILPLVQTIWDQGTPYNNLCPISNGKLTVTGCVATSMAQVMNYHKYPEVGTGSVSFTSSRINQRLSMNFADQAFDWDNMLNIYNSGEYTDAQSNAVAYLMKACGYSVEMSYGVDASGASGRSIAAALTKYFKYSETAEDLERNRFSGSAWEQKMYDNLKNIGPVVINGQAPMDGGHSFVCDGYDGNGYFHINWGWGGISDGYFALDALNPDAQGTGGAIGGFNFSQNAIFGVQPPTGEPVEKTPDMILQYGSTIATIDGKTATFDVTDYTFLGWGNATNHKISCNIGAIITPENGSPADAQTVQGKLGVMSTVTVLNSSSYYMSSRMKPTVDLPDLADGVYTVTLACKPVSGSEWSPVETMWGHRNYFILTVANGAYTATNVPIASVKPSNVKNVTELYAGKYFQIQATMTNSSDLEITQGFSPALYDNTGKRVFVGESVLVTLMPGESVDKVWSAKFYTPKGGVASVKEDTEYTLKFYDPSNNSVYENCEATVVMKPNPGTAAVGLQAVEILDTEKIEVITVDDREYRYISHVQDASNMNVHIAFKVNRGYFDGLLTIGIYEPNPANPYSLLPVIDQVYSATPYLGEGGVFDETININFSEAKEGHVYYVYGKYTADSSERVLTNIPFYYGTVGVDNVIGDTADAPVEVYNLQGVRIANPAPGQIVIVKRGNKTSKTVWSE